MITVQRIDDDPEKPKAQLVIDNGDLAALEDAISKWQFKDEASMLRFMVAILRESNEQHVVYVTGKGGKQIAFAPAEKLLNTDSRDKEATDGTTISKSDTSKSE